MKMAKHNLILIGFSGTGKTNVGRLVGSILGWQFVDTDEEIASQTGKPVHRIFVEDGEEAFRTLEREVVRQVCSNERRVIAAGGGAFIDPDSRALMLAKGLVVCLDASPETIDRRLAGAEPSPEARPLLSGPNRLGRIKALKTERQPFYNLAHRTISTDGLEEHEVAREVAILVTQDPGGDPVYGEALAANVHHSTGSYTILVGHGLLDRLGPFLSELGVAGPAYIISDEQVFRAYGRRAQSSLEQSSIPAHSYVIPPGEGSKSFEMAQDIYAWLAEIRAERGHTVVTLGGGVVGDLAGFVAATYMRGMRFIQVPTSLTAMVDASIGGKVAVNLPQGKNLVGAFYQPTLVLADLDTLTTLGPREVAEGWAEAIKHGLILDRDLVDLFEEHAQDLLSLKGDITTQVIRRSVAIKAQVVTQDERDTLGRRILLNYGHTIGHALEAASGYGRYLHGEAVSIGMEGAARISHALGMVSTEVVARQRRLLERFGLPTSAPGTDPQAILDAIAMDKKIEAASVKWVLLEEIGRATVSQDVPAELVEETVRHLTL